MHLEDYEFVDDDDLDDFGDDDDLDTFEQFMDDVIGDDDEDDIDGEDIDDIERRRRRKRRRRKLRRSRSSFSRGRKPKNRYATVEQVSKGFARSDRNDKALGNRITSLSRSTSSFATRTNKRLKSQQGDIDSVKQMTLLTSLLSSDKKLKIKTVTDPQGNALPEEAAKAVNGATITFSDASDSLDKFLPFLMMGGLGGKGGGLGDNPLMLFLLLDGLGNK